MKTLVLFDIDGTLVSGGPAKEAFQHAMEATYGTAGATDRVSFSGKTDPQIARELLRSVGMSDQEVDRGFPSLWDRYLEGLRARLPERPMQVLPGVQALVETLHAHADAGLALVTGNIVDGARLKLGSAGLDHRFPLDGTLVGGFGSDSEHRDDLPGIALERARAVWGRTFRAEEAVIVGDTPRDIACGRFAGTRTVGVSTGKFSSAQLREAGADVVLEDFQDTRLALEAILS